MSITERALKRESVAGLLKRLRLHAELSQEELSERSGVSFRTISNIETGARRPRIATMRLLADALRLSPELQSLLQRAARQERLYLPAAPALIGREDALARLRIACDKHALVTITGPPGVGKTSLALHFANDVIDHYEGGVAFVALDVVDDADVVPLLIARSLGMEAGEGGTELRSAVIERLQGGSVLLVLDTIEHILGSASFVADIVKAAPQVRVLATGRCPFELSLEYELPLAPLSHEAAVALFKQRASSVVDPHEPDVAKTQDIERICTQLDGLPLALELAAMRVRSLSYAQVLDRAPRHRALDVAISWSYDLLDEDARAVLCRFAIFPSGATMDDAEVVCAAGARAIDGLVRQNLLIAEGYGSARRLRMLQTIREYAMSRLQENGEFALVAQRFIGRMREVSERLSGDSAQEVFAALARFEAEQFNLQAALQWAADTLDWESGIRIACALDVPWRIRNLHGHAIHWFKTLAAATPALPDIRLRFRLLNVAVDWLACRDELDLARQYAPELLTIADSLGDPNLRAWGLLRWEASLFENDRKSVARDRCKRILSEYGDGEDRALLGLLHNAIAVFSENPEDKVLHFDFAIRHAAAAGKLYGRPHLLVNLANAYTSLGEYEHARIALSQAIEFADAMGHTLALAHAQINRAELFLHLGETEPARVDLLESFDVLSGAQHPLLLASCLEEAAHFFGIVRMSESQARLLALAEQYFARLGSAFLNRRSTDLDRLRSQLGERSLREHWEAGQTLRIDEVIEMLYEAGARWRQEA